MNEDRVIAVIPSLGRNIDRLNHCINSVKKYSNFSNLKIILVDNSPDGSLQNIYNVDEVIGLGINLGFVGAVEIVRRKFEAEFIWTLQDDISFSTNVLSNLMKEIKTSSQLAAVCPITLNKNLLSNPRSGKFINNDVTQWNLYPESGTEISSLDTEVDFIYSSGSLWRMSALEEINGFNLELYPSYHVDVDTCYRLNKKKWKVKLAGNAVIEHEGQGSTPKLLSRVLAVTNRKILSSMEKKEILKYDETELDIILSILKKSSFLFLDVAHQGDSDILKLSNDLENHKPELHTVVNPNSWKITKPLRQLRKKFKI